MTRRPAPIFRGSELPRLVILAAIALAGWPLVILFARARDEPQPAPPPAIPAAAIAPVVPDAGVEFQALVDKAPMQGRENAAYALLLDRARRTSAADLAASARRDVLFTHLWERPAAYRGVPVHIRGTALRVLTYEANPGLTPTGRLYEAWVYADDNRLVPYVLAFDEPPPGLVVGSDLFLKVRFDGYFLKLLAYSAGDKRRASPLFVGRLVVEAAPPPAPAPMVEVRDAFRRHGFLVVFVLAGGYIALRAFFQVRRLLAPAARPTARPGRTASPAEADPAAVSEWLDALDRDGLDEDDEPPAPR